MPLHLLTPGVRDLIPVPRASDRPTAREGVPRGPSGAPAAGAIVAAVPGAISTATADTAAAHTADPAPSTAGLQGTSLSLARILGRIVTALDLLLSDDDVATVTALPGTGPTAEVLQAVREELRRAREELAPLQGTGDALLSAAGRDATSQQRTDPSHAPHFGG